MTAAHAFLDVLANSQVRDAYLAGRITIILSADFETILWVNGAGARFMGLRNVADSIGIDSGFDRLTRHQIEAGLDSAQPVRVSGIPHSEVFLVNAAHLAPLGNVVFLRSVGAQITKSNTVGVNLIEGLSDETTHTALLTLEANIMASSANFNLKWFDEGELADLLAQAHHDGKVKKRLLKNNPDIAVGVLELNHDPAIILLIAAQTIEEQEGVVPASAQEFTFNPAILPLHFSWKVDENIRFNEVSSELAHAVGAYFSDIEGKKFSDIAQEWQLDGDGTVRALFKSHNAWSQRKILWPVEGGQRVEITLFALPVYSRERVFIGFRGYGIINEVEGAVVMEEGEAMKSLHIPKGLSEQEKEAFSTIARTLRADLNEAAPPPQQDEDSMAGEDFQQAPERFAESVRRFADKKRDGNKNPGQSVESSETDTDLETPTEAPQFAHILSASGEGQMAPPSIEGQEVVAVLDENPHPAPAMVPPSPTHLTFEQRIVRTFADPSRWDEILGDEMHENEMPEGEEGASDKVTHDMLREEDAVAPMPAPTENLVWEHGVLPGAALSPIDTEIQLLQHVPVSVLIYRDDKVLFANNHLLTLTGFASLDAFRLHGVLRLILRDWLPKNILQGLNGEIYPVRSHMRAMSWFDGVAASMISFMPREDDALSTLTREFEALQKKAIELSVLLNLVDDGVLIVDEGGIVHSLNDAAARLLDQAQEAIKGQHFSQFFAQSTMALLNQHFDTLRQRQQNKPQQRDAPGAAVVAELKLKTGASQTVHLRFAPMEMDKGYYIILSDHGAVVEDQFTFNKAHQDMPMGGRQEANALALVSHEIRTPLNAIVGLSQMILAEKYGPLHNDRYRTYLRDIIRSSDHIMTLVNDLLDNTKNPSKITVQVKPMALELVLNEILGMMAPQVSRARIIMRSNIAANLPPIAADQRSVKQMVFNLLSNALRFTPAGGQIIVSAMAAQGEVLLRIRDTGSGMNTAMLEKVMNSSFDPAFDLNAPEAFAPFAAHHHKDAGGGGTGMGLPLVKALAKANGAQFSLRSEPGKGTLAEIIFAKA